MIYDLSPEEKKVLEEFRSRIEDELPPVLKEDPSVFYRFLKARNFVLKDAESMLRKHITWRKTYKIDNILTDFETPEVFRKYFVSSPLGFDKDGTPVRYMSAGGTDVKGLMMSLKTQTLLRCNFQVIEEDILLLKRQSEKLGKPVTQFGYICDYDNFSFAKATDKKYIELSMLGSSMFQDNYPERVKYLYIVNASIYFTMMFSIVKHVVPSSLLSKIKIFGTDGYQEELCQLLDPDILPTFLGGRKTCTNNGLLVPESYYLTKSKKTLSNTTGFTKLKVTRFSRAAVNLEVQVPGSVLEWEFETDSRDIGFGICFRQESWSKENSIEIVPLQRIDTSYEPETGMYKCEKAGIYILVFDNSYSWIHSKNVYYQTKVIMPKDQTNSLQ